MSKPKKPIREIPAYQEYAADLLANRRYRLMSYSERGLFDTMRKECWVNRSVPADAELLAKYLGQSHAETLASLTQRVKSFFESDGVSFRSQELDAYRKMLEDRQAALSEGGRNGGLKTQQQIKDKASLEATVKPLSRDELNRVESNKEELINKKDHKEWLAEYDRS